MNLRFLPQAQAELLHEVAYYSEARTGAGVRFQAAIEAAIDKVSRHPQGGAPSSHGTRTMLFKGYPFSIVYRASEAEILVIAIAGHKRRPNYWEERAG